MTAYAGKIVLRRNDADPGESLRRVFAQARHRARDLLHALLALQRIALDALAEKAVFFIDFIQRVGERHAAPGVADARFRREHRRADRVLIAREPAREETEALLKPKQKRLFAAGLVFVHLFADEPKARHHVLQLYAVCRANRVRKARGDDTLDHDAVPRQSVLPAHRGENVLYENAADLVSRKRQPFVRLRLDRNAEAIRIRIGRKAHASAFFLRERNGKAKRVRILRVRRGDGRKSPVRRALLRHGDHVRQPHAG